MTGKILIVLADSLLPVNDHRPDPFLEVMTLAFDDFYRKVASGEIVDSKSIVVALWYRQIRSAAERGSTGG